MPECKRKYVIVNLNDDCGLVQRAVNEDADGKRFIKANGGKIYLSSIRGKYRYLDKSI